MSDYTPTTVWIEAAWGRIRAADGIPVGESLAEFRRWLAAHDAEVRADEREKAAQRVLSVGSFAGHVTPAKYVAAARGDGAE